MVDALLTARQVIDAKHNACTDRLNEDRLGDMAHEALARFVREMEDPLSTVITVERARVVALLSQ